MATNKYISFNIAGNGGGGGTGGTMNIVELTKAQYEALVDKDPDALYVITDADVIDLNDYALASALTALDTATTASLANKADKANVTARTSGYYFPKWSSQGVISGDTQVYQRSLSINGTAKNMIQGTNSDFTGIYAPTAAGSAGQPLLSSGSGNAPVWGGYKFAFITQTDYDALTTPDATTIYFIIGD